MRVGDNMSSLNSLMETFNKVVDYFVEKNDISRSDNRASKIPNSGIDLGVKYKDIRKYAKENLDLFDDIINCPDNLYYDLDILKVQTILVNSKLTLEEKLGLIDKLSFKINNFGVCDNLGHGLKVSDDEMPKLFEYAKTISKSDLEFRSRLGLIIILSKFVNETYLDQIFALLSEITNSSDYVEKAMISILKAAIEVDFHKTLVFITENHINSKVKHRFLKKVSYANLRKNEIKILKETAKTK